MTTTARSWEFIAIDLVYRDKDPVTVAILPRNYPDLSAWLTQNVERPKIGEHVFVYTYDVTLH
jgi:hypothetical protein